MARIGRSQPQRALVTRGSSSNNVVVAVPAGSLTLAGLVPVVKTPRTIAVPAGALTLTGFAPAVVIGASKIIQVPAGALTLTGLAPTVATTARQLIKPPAGALSLTGYPPTVLAQSVQPSSQYLGGAPGRTKKGQYPTPRAQTEEEVRKQREEMGIVPPAKKSAKKPDVSATKVSGQGLTAIPDGLAGKDLAIWREWLAKDIEKAGDSDAVDHQKIASMVVVAGQAAARQEEEDIVFVMTTVLAALD